MRPHPHPTTSGRRTRARRAAPNPVEPLALSVSEAASGAGLSKQTLYNLWAAGKGPAYIIVGVRRLVRREALVEWLRDLERQQGEARS